MLIRLDSIDDPRLSDFREIKEKSLLDRGLFLAEGENVVLRLLRSEVKVKAVVLAEHRVDVADEALPETPIYVLPADLVSKLVGFAFHSGVIACGIVPASPPLELAVPRTGPARVVVLPEIAQAENLGTLIRLSAGLGADAMVVGERCTSPWLRRTVRVSMGSVFSLPIVRSPDILRDLRRLRDELRVTPLATALHPDAEVLGTREVPDRIAVLFGSEAHGLREEEWRECPRKVIIPMSLGVDSLNVGVSAGIVLWELFGRGDRK